jgi:glycosyltransferase involved in cell wall biosynthesis
VVVHSEYARGRVAEDITAPVRKIDFPPFGPAAAYVANPPARSVSAAGAKVRLLTFGVLNPNKLVHAIIEAVGRNPRLRSAVTLTVIGEGHGAYVNRLRELIRTHRLDDVVTLAGWRSDDELRRELAASDVVLNLRNPHTGESSAVLLNSLLAGVATVVWDHGFYAEFPDDVVLKVASEEELPGALEKLAGDADLRARLGRNARGHALARFNTASYVAQFRRFADEVLRAAPVLALADQVSDRLRELGANGLDGLAGQIAREIASLCLPAETGDEVARAA